MEDQQDLDDCAQGQAVTEKLGQKSKKDRRSSASKDRPPHYRRKATRLGGDRTLGVSSRGRGLEPHMTEHDGTCLATWKCENLETGRVLCLLILDKRKKEKKKRKVTSTQAFGNADHSVASVHGNPACRQDKSVTNELEGRGRERSREREREERAEKSSYSFAIGLLSSSSSLLSRDKRKEGKKKAMNELWLSSSR